MGDALTRAVVLTGAPGAGKTSVCEALATLLEIEGIAYGAIESEQLVSGSPWLDATFGARALAAVIALQREAGRELFVVVATTETDAELRQILQAIGAQRSFVACLRAPAEVVAERVALREPDAWPGKARLVEHARDLADAIPALEGVDAVIDTAGREPADAAGELLAALRAAGIV